MKVFAAEWEQSNEYQAFADALKDGDTVEYREWVAAKVAEYKEDYRRDL